MASYKVIAAQHAEPVEYQHIVPYITLSQIGF